MAAHGTPLAPTDAGQRQRGVRRAAVLLGIVAAVFYVGFIAMMVWRATR
jgi:hypothetical protein